MHLLKIRTRHLAIIALFTVTLGIGCAKSSSPNSKNEFEIDVTVPEHVLQNYLLARSSGKLSVSVKFLSQSYINNFLLTQKRGYVDYYRVRETNYLEFLILSKRITSPNKAIFDVSVMIEDPGVRSKLNERYTLLLSDNSWKINEIEHIGQQEKFEVLKSDGTWVKPE